MRFGIDIAGIAVLWLTFAAAPLWSQEPEIPAGTVGMPVEIPDLVLPGPELEPAPITDDTPVVIRIDAVYPHGTGFRYDLVCYALEPGEHDLRDYLRRKDGSATDDLPQLLLASESLLPAGQIEPHQLVPGSLPWLGGYRLLLLVVGVVWLAGLVWILYPKRKAAAPADASPAEPTSLADRLRPLILEAVDGRAEPARLAELERALVRYWRRRLQLEDIPVSEALTALREHAEAGALMTQLEFWLHQPANASDVDVNTLLAPYRNVSPNDIPLSRGDRKGETVAPAAAGGTR